MVSDPVPAIALGERRSYDTLGLRIVLEGSMYLAVLFYFIPTPYRRYYLVIIVSCLTMLYGLDV